MLSEAQLELRRAFVGGSEIASVVGLDPYRVELDTWLAKAEGYSPPVTGPMERGTFLEPGIAAWYAHRTGATLTEPGTLVSPKRPFAGCTPDRVATEPSRVKRLLSIKAPGPFAREDWGDEWTEDVPLAYLLQLQWEDMVCTDCGIEVDEVFHLAAPVDGDLRIYKLRRDRGLQADLYEQAARWWRKYVLTNTAPPIDGSDTAKAWLQRRFPRNRQSLVQASPDAEVMALQVREAEQRRDEAADAFEAAKNRMKEVIGEADGIQGAFGRIDWRADKNGKRAFRPKWRKQ